MRAELKRRIPKKPSEYLKRMYFDSIVHSVTGLQYLVEVVGADRVVMGTDYPMAMDDFEPVNKVKQLQLAGRDKDKILGGNAAGASRL